jgi:hypothetical protein
MDGGGELVGVKLTVNWAKKQSRGKEDDGRGRLFGGKHINVHGGPMQ